MAYHLISSWMLPLRTDLINLEGRIIALSIGLGRYFINLVVLVVLLLLAGTIFAQAGQSTNKRPLTYGLLLDNSYSLRSELPKVKEVAKLIVNNNLSDDETFIVRLIQEKKTTLLVDVTTDKSLLLAGVNSLKSEAAQTALIDGIYSSADYLSQLKNKAPDRHCALVIISDGEDRASSYKPEKLVALLKQVNCPLFFLGFIDQLDQEGGFARESPRVKARKLIEQLTKETGGRAFFVEKGSDLTKLVQSFTKALRA
jgi:Ca-activated chloride channel family protein